MKKVLFLIFIASAVLAIATHPAKASPKEELLTISASDIVSDMATPVVFKYEAMNIEQITWEAVAPIEYQVPVKMILKEPLAPGRLWLYRHYFNHEDLKKYPEYIPEKLSSGFPLPIDRPAR